MVKKTIDYECRADERRYLGSREDLDRYRGSPRDTDPERKYRDTEYDER